MDYLVTHNEKPSIPSINKPWKNGDYNDADAVVKVGNGSNINIIAGRLGSANYSKILGKLKEVKK